jgi:hypothetical protein
MSNVIGLARIDWGPALSAVRAPTWASDAVKATPGRQWDAYRKCWRVPTEWVAQLRERLEADGFVVRIIEPGVARPQTRRRHRSKHRSDLVNSPINPPSKGDHE